MDKNLEKSADLAKAPDAIEVQRERLKKAGGEYIYDCDDTGKKYVYIALGERPTGGYSIKTEVEKQENKIVVKYKEVKPAKGDMVTMVITYPEKLLIFDTEKEIEVKKIN
ncbi:protease complex subunit PrcB family protein [Proteinivorax hydrogeniformans]|uniref:Protease complex subunit PrcB family protein n=1 Tax=Proteinivorax hydrogeniformans TaxID=1826727 RepID=A0AAU8HV33_9FIRM